MPYGEQPGVGREARWSTQIGRSARDECNVDATVHVRPVGRWPCRGDKPLLGRLAPVGRASVGRGSAWAGVIRWRVPVALALLPAALGRSLPSLTGHRTAPPNAAPSIRRLDSRRLAPRETSRPPFPSPPPSPLPRCAPTMPVGDAGEVVRRSTARLSHRPRCANPPLLASRWLGPRSD